MRLLTPVAEESDSSKIYQELSTASRSTGGNYSEVDTSIMSIISEVLTVRSRDGKAGTGRAASPAPRLPTIEEDTLGTNCLLSTIEEIRNNSMCNLYTSSESGAPGPTPGLGPGLPRVPPRNTAGYHSLCEENSRVSREKNERCDLAESLEAEQAQRTQVGPAPGPPPQHHQLNDSIKSVNSNTLVVTPKTVVAAASKKKETSPLQTGRGCRKNILNLVPTTRDILNTPKRLASTLQAVRDNSLLSDSLASENNEFKALMPHLTNTGAKFLNRVKSTPTETDSEADLDGSFIKQTNAMPILGPIKERLNFTSPGSAVSSNFSTFSTTPSPATFVRNIGNQARPKRKLSIVREKIENNRDDDSDYKYGFVKENPDAKYGFGYFPTDSYNVVETAKLSNNSYRSFTAAINPVIEKLQDSLDQLAAPPLPAAYSLSALNKADTAFKLAPDETYENLGRGWGTASLQRRPLRPAFPGREAVGRRSMSILDTADEKENIVPHMRREKPGRAPLAPSSPASNRRKPFSASLPQHSAVFKPRTSSVS